MTSGFMFTIHGGNGFGGITNGIVFDDIKELLIDAFYIVSAMDDNYLLKEEYVVGIEYLLTMVDTCATIDEICRMLSNDEILENTGLFGTQTMTIQFVTP